MQTKIICGLHILLNYDTPKRNTNRFHSLFYKNYSQYKIPAQTKLLNWFWAGIFQ